MVGIYKHPTQQTHLSCSHGSMKVEIAVGFEAAFSKLSLGDTSTAPGQKHDSQEPDSCLGTNMDFPCGRAASSLGLQSQNLTAR